MLIMRTAIVLATASASMAADDVAMPFASFPAWPLPRVASWTPTNSTTADGVVCGVRSPRELTLSGSGANVPLVLEAWERASASVFAAIWRCVRTCSSGWSR